MKRIAKIILAPVLTVTVGAGGLLGWLTAVEYKPEPVVELACSSPADTSGLRNVKPGEEISVLSWNIGYGGLGKSEDFFMDGGKKAKPKDKDTVLAYLDGINRTITEQAPEIIMLQEVDSNSSRTFSIDEQPLLNDGMISAAYALNYSCPYVPVPLPPIGKVHSGLFTMADGLQIEKSERIALPCPFSWPLRIANLKRCLLVSYLPVEGSDRQLVLVNLHLEAYDDGEGKIAQTNQLRDFIESEYAKGNYVIAGGDFNQVFPGSLEVYPNTHEKNWKPGVLDEALLPEGWTLAYDLSTPTCRLLNQPYDPSDTAGTQHYVIDGLILSPNVQLKSVQTLDEGFANSDHNPVRVQAMLQNS